jgi:putative aminopeptidase FrvX
MEDGAREFLLRLLAATGPSGFERPAAQVWRAEAADRGLEVSHDLTGNSVARLPGREPRVAVVGHIDELGLMITHIDDEGFLWFRPIGGWDDQVLVGQRVRILAQAGEVIGLIGRKPTHLMQGDERDRGARAQDLWIDIGARDGAEARARVRVGDPTVLDLAPVELRNNRLAGRAIDNRVGAFLALETVRLLQPSPPVADIYAIATAQEEIGLAGAFTGAFSLAPTVAIIVDVTFATDVPSADKHGEGNHPLGSGPVIARGSSVNPVVFERLVAAAEAAAIPYTIEANPRNTGTDADAIARTGRGVACGVVFVPSRYMHTPNETVCLDDIDSAARLIAAFIAGLEPDTDFRPS